ncbi:MAG: hypothetical protein JST22_19390 [Bacteroidetes bacterium]|nr:hypothetical protein [Bacteroidota bacterium]
MATLHVFADLKNAPGLAQTAAQAFGPQSATLFRTTCTFTTTSNITAYAAVKGTVMVQKISATLVNLVLRPTVQSDVAFTPVKYFIYRGLDITKFLNATFDHVAARTGATAYITKVYEHADRLATAKSGTPTTASAPESTAIGWDGLNSSPTDKLDSFFFSDHADYQPVEVDAGTVLGDFDKSGFGVDIVLEDGSWQYDLAWVRATANQIDVSSYAGDEQKWRREEAITFVDPAAYYGMHFDLGVGAPSGALTGDHVYNDFVKYFPNTKNAVYLDIRNENNRSLNYYGNYDDGTGKQVKIGKTSATYALDVYAATSWPLIIRNAAGQTSTTTTATKNEIHLGLRIDDNKKPLLILEHADCTIASAPADFIDGPNLLPAMPSGWTNELVFRFPNIDVGVSGDRSNVATVIKLTYARQYDATTVYPASGKVVKTQSYTDNVFGPIGDLLPWAGPKTALWTTTHHRKYVDATTVPAVSGSPVLKFGYMARTGRAEESDTVYYYALPETFYRSGDPTRNADRLDLRAGYSSVETFLPTLVIQHPSLTYTVSRIYPVGGSDRPALFFNVQDDKRRTRWKASLLLLVLARTDLTSLQTAATSNLNAFHEQFLVLRGETAKTDANGIDYFEYEVMVAGYQTSDGTYGAFGAGTPVKVISLASDRTSFTSLALTAIPSLTGAPGTSGMDYEEKLADQDRVKGKAAVGSIPAVHGLLEDEPEMTRIKDEFITTLNGYHPPTKTHADFESLVQNYARQILARARYTTNAPSWTPAASIQQNDDRPLYWNRLLMRKAIRGHADMAKDNLFTQRLLRVLETESRGYEAIQFAGNSAFSSITSWASVKKIIVTGFDPFFLDGTTSYGNPLQSNPSGASALAVHNFIVRDGGGTPIGAIQAVLFPVRWRDFDEDGGPGVIERVLEKYIEPGSDKVDYIFTLSQAGPGEFWIDRFPGRVRGGTAPDNEGLPNSSFPKRPQGNPFYETTLPYAKMIGTATTIQGFKYIYNQTFSFASSNTVAVQTSIYDISTAANRPAGLTVKIESASPRPGGFIGVAPSQLTSMQNQYVTTKQGSGGDYLSNEIMYRVALMRQQWDPSMPTGHLHVPKLQNSNPSAADYKYADTVKVIDAVKEAIKAAIS